MLRLRAPLRFALKHLPQPVIAFFRFAGSSHFRLRFTLIKYAMQCLQSTSYFYFFHLKHADNFAVPDDCIGKVAGGILTVRFTHRKRKIRIIGAGNWRKGKKIYEEEN